MRKIGIAFAVAALACGGGGESELAGTWRESGPGGAEALWVFGEDGSLSWTVIGQPSGAFGDLTYEVVSGGPRYEVDVTGFEEGPMAGETLYCIAEFEGTARMRLDCRPGESEAARPTSFTGEALELTLQVGEAEGADTTAQP